GPAPGPGRDLDRAVGVPGVWTTYPLGIATGLPGRQRRTPEPGLRPRDRPPGPGTGCPAGVAPPLLDRPDPRGGHAASLTPGPQRTPPDLPGDRPRPARHASLVPP